LECKFQFAATAVVGGIHQTYFYGIQHLGMKDRSLIDKIKPIFIAPTVTAIHHRLSAWKTDDFSIPPECGPVSGEQSKCNTRNINDVVNNTSPDVFCCLNLDFCLYMPVVTTKNIGNIHSMIC
jgi:hypothetical protein